MEMPEIDYHEPQGENPGVDLGEAVADLANDSAAREDGPTTPRMVEIEGQKIKFHKTRYQAALERGRLAVDEIIDYTAEHPVKVAIGTIAIGVLLAQIRNHYVGKGPKLTQ